MTKISYIVGTHNEPANYIKPLLDQLLKYKDLEDEIVVVDDFSTNQETIDTLAVYQNLIRIEFHALNGDFAAHKNYKNSLAKGDWIVDIDADENINELLMQTLKEIIQCNPAVEAYQVPRINIVPDITDEDMKRYGWSFFPGTAMINYPDYQTRIYKNSDSIKWTGKVHEQLSGFTQHTSLPYLNGEGKPDPSYALLHIKNRDRQIKQNNFYDTI